MVANGGLILKSLVQKVSVGPVEHQYPSFFTIFWSQKRGGQLLWVPMRESDPDGHLNSSIDDGWMDRFWRPLFGCGYGGRTRLPLILPHRCSYGKGRAPAPRPAIQLGTSVRARTEQQTCLKGTHTYTDYSCQSGYRKRNVNHAKQRVAPSLCDLSLITPVSESPCRIPLSLFPPPKKKRDPY